MKNYTNKIFKVGDSYRKNPLSKQKGGVTLMVEQDNYIKEYHNIHHVDAYMKKVMCDKTVTRVWEKGGEGEYDTLIYSQ
tara:strand:- start:894 stop:1130 length:237 start_codon:yes stop_codon:yes gene_type:complete